MRRTALLVVLITFCFVNAWADDRALLNALVFPELNPGLTLDSKGKVVRSTDWDSKTQNGFKTYWRTNNGEIFNSFFTGLVLKDGAADSIESVTYIRQGGAAAMMRNGIIRMIFLKGNNIDFIANCNGVPDHNNSQGQLVAPKAKCVAINRDICQKIYGVAGVKSAQEFSDLKKTCENLDRIFNDGQLIDDFKALLDAKFSTINASLQATARATGGIEHEKVPTLKPPPQKERNPLNGYDESTVLSICSQLDRGTPQSAQGSNVETSK